MLKALVHCACYVLKASLSYQLGALLVKKAFLQKGLCSTAAHGWHRVWGRKKMYRNFYHNFAAIYHNFAAIYHNFTAIYRKFIAIFSGLGDVNPPLPPAQVAGHQQMPLDIVLYCRAAPGRVLGYVTLCPLGFG